VRLIKLKATPIVLATAVSLLTGCRAIGPGAALAVGAVGLTGYAVYKTGDAAVTGVGTVAKATGDALSSGTKSAATVIFFAGEFKTEYAQDIKTVWTATRMALIKAKFVDVRGTFDALSGELTAKTGNDTEIVVKLKGLGPQSSEARIRIGVQGDLKKAEMIHELILREFPAPVEPQPAAKPAVEVKS